MTAGVTICCILRNCGDHHRLILLIQLPNCRLGSSFRCGSAESSAAICAELGLVSIERLFRFVVDGDHSIGAAFPGFSVDCGNRHVITVSECFRILFQAVRRYTAHCETSHAWDAPCGQVQVKQICGLPCVLAVHLKEVANLVQHDIIRVRRFYSIVAVPLSVSLLKLLILCLFLWRKKSVFSDKLGYAFGDIRPAHLHIRAVLLFQDNAFAIVILAAVGSAGYRM